MECAHPLYRWLEDSGERRIDFARRIGCSGPHLSLIAQGKRGVSLDLALAIERETGGQITAQQMLEHRQETAA